MGEGMVGAVVHNLDGLLRLGLSCSLSMSI
jgi:hypothetical protein